MESWLAANRPDYLARLLPGGTDAESDFDRPEWWRRGWVPLLSNGGGSHLQHLLAVKH
jgi:hypothetical protein